MRDVGWVSDVMSDNKSVGFVRCDVCGGGDFYGCGVEEVDWLSAVGSHSIPTPHASKSHRRTHHTCHLSLISSHFIDAR